MLDSERSFETPFNVLLFDDIIAISSGFASPESINCLTCFTIKFRSSLTIFPIRSTKTETAALEKDMIAISSGFAPFRSSFAIRIPI